MTSSTFGQRQKRLDAHSHHRAAVAEIDELLRLLRARALALAGGDDDRGYAHIESAGFSLRRRHRADARAVTSSTCPSRADVTSTGANTTTSASVGRRRHHRARRIRGGIAKRPGLVDERDPPADVDRVLADAGVLLAVAADAQRDGAVICARS